MPLFVAFFVALAVTVAVIPLLSRWAGTAGLTDRPGARKIHRTPIPRVGGIAMAAGIFTPLLLGLPLSPAMSGLLAGAAILVVFGVWDDRADLDYRVKFAGQIAAVALCMAIGGVNIGHWVLIERLAIPAVISLPLTFVFLVGITNAVNLSDGLDGLAGGMALLSLCAVAVLAALNGNGAVTVVALVECGAILGFLRFNTYPARVFMGDAGSQLLGFSMGVLAIEATQGEASTVSSAAPLLLLAMPIIDTLSVIWLRVRAGRSPFASDRNHIHHRLLDLGFAHSEAVALTYLVQVGLFLLAYLLRFESDLLILAISALFAVLTLLILHRAERSHWRAHGGGESGLLRRFRELRAAPPPVLVAVPLWTVRVGILAYAALVLATDAAPGRDLSVLCALLLVMLAALAVTPVSRSSGLSGWIERAVLYVSVMVLVYLDQTTADRPQALRMLLWGLVAVAGAAGAVRVVITGTRRFEVTALDLLIAFVALVVPSLPGLVPLPAALVGGIAKSMVLLYVVEFQLESEARVPPRRWLLAAALATIVLRAL